jgi:hypothetical protein
MSPEVTAAIIAASVSFLTLVGTLAAQYLAAATPNRRWKNSVSSWTERSQSSAPGP